MADGVDIDKLQEAIDELKKIIQQLRKANSEILKDTTKEYKEREKLVRDGFNQQRREIREKYKEGETRKRLLGLIDQEEKALDRRLDQEEKLYQKASKVTKVFGGLFTAAETGTGTISSFTDAFKVNEFGAVIAGLGNRLDTNIETFRQLSQVGANFGQSIVALRQSAAQAALPLDDFAKLVGENSEGLAALFGSSTQGAQQIGRLASAVRTQGIDALAPLGFTVDELNETLLLNLERQRRTGAFANMSSQEQIDSAIRFATELDRLAKLTGQQRDELRKQIEQQQANERFQAFLLGKNDETRTRLEGFTAAIGNMSPMLAEGFQDLIANAGVPVTDAAMALVQNAPELRGVVNDLISGTTNAEMALVRTRDASLRSSLRFQKATQTGTVDFLNLQSGFIKLANTTLDVNSVFAEQGKSATGLTGGLTTFEDATKKLSSQFQQIETGLLQGFGPALGGLANATQSLMGGVGGLTQAIAGIPALTGTAIAGVLAGKFLFDKAERIAIIAAGVKIGNKGLTGLMKGMGLGKGGALSKMLGMKGGIAGKGLKGAGMLGGRLLPGLGAAIGIGSSASMLFSKDEETKAKGKGGLAGAAGGAALGAAIGSVVPVIGTVIGGLIGAGLGSMGGQFVGGKLAKRDKPEGREFGGLMIPEIIEPEPRQFGGGMDASEATAKPYLVGEKGPEIVAPKVASSVVANQDLQKTFDTEQLENQMSTMVSELNAANKTLTNMVNSVNTLVAVERRALAGIEKTARKDPTQIGMV